MQCVDLKKKLINASGACDLLLLLVGSLPLRFYKAINPVGWAGSGWVVLHHTSGRTFGPYGFNDQARLQGGSSVESGFEPEALLPPSSRPYHQATAAPRIDCLTRS
ncbi:hypothetical protein AVEN_63097-1 [Araneus ventricosus]|uniref:Uncharacterized protein n=1 Tax=Araneus ventricosus TaxID=182803 RepID=A0A4Y2EJR4_ARAVE|nr:hypothetical protein AVEN_36372-1 [Araneus ventricosus]GBM30439.1 hypothetical protein AVEN_63097-1 [Araneus ventricosus]